jgi:predicted ester cyclase/predicted enzyme related to lactoylglutathione lyase
MLGPLVAFVPTADLERSHAFYGGVLELERVQESPFANAYDVQGTVLRATLVDEPARAPYTVLGWSVADLVEEIDRLSDRGASFKRYPTLEQDAAGVWTAPGGSRIAWFEDPDGNTLSLQEAPGGGQALVRRFYEQLWNSAEMSVADEIVATEIRFRGTLGGELRGLPAFKSYVEEVRAAFADWHNEIDELIGADGRIVARITCSGTHTGRLRGIEATGRRVSYAAVGIFRISGGLIREAWVVGDTQELWRVLSM